MKLKFSLGLMLTGSAIALICAGLAIPPAFTALKQSELDKTLEYSFRSVALLSLGVFSGGSLVGAGSYLMMGNEIQRKINKRKARKLFQESIEN